MNPKEKDYSRIQDNCQKSPQEQLNDLRVQIDRIDCVLTGLSEFYFESVIGNDALVERSYTTIRDTLLLARKGFLKQRDELKAQFDRNHNIKLSIGTLVSNMTSPANIHQDAIEILTKAIEDETNEQ
jgi:hypothetical protein